jgi:hypothetical protein
LCHNPELSFNGFQGKFAVSQRRTSRSGLLRMIRTASPLDFGHPVDATLSL